MTGIPLSELDVASVVQLADGLYIVQNTRSYRVPFSTLVKSLGMGWVYVESDATTLSPVSPSSTYFDDWQTLPINGLGAKTDATYGGSKGTSLANWWDGERIQPDAVGEVYHFTLRFNIRDEFGSSGPLGIRFNVGDSTDIVPFVTQSDYPSYEQVGYSWSAPVTEDFYNNGGTIQVLVESAVSIFDIGLLIQRTAVPNV